MKKIICLLISVIMVFVLVSCGSKSTSSPTQSGYYDKSGAAFYEDGNNSPSKEYAPEVDYSNKDSSEEYSRKIIKKQYLTIETLEFDKGVEELEKLVVKFGGYFSSGEISNGSSIRYTYSSSTRTATYTIRVPSENLDDFVKETSGKFNVLSSRLSSDEITDTYYDLKAQYDSLKLQEERLEEMMKKADKLSDLITLDDKLTEVRSKMNYIWSRIQYYDKAVDMSFVYITLYEVQKYAEVEDPTYGERVGEAAGGGWSAFATFMGDIFIGILYLFPFLLTAGAVAVVIIVIIRQVKKKSRAKTEQNKTTGQQDK